MASSSADTSHLVDVSKWFKAVESYVKETEANHLVLPKELEIDNVRSVFKFLPHSHITSLSLQNVDLSGGVKNFIDLLVKTKIEEFSLCSCNLTEEDLLNFMKILKKTRITKLDISKNHLQLDERAAKEFATYLHRSQLIDLNFGLNSFTPEVGGLLLMQELRNMSITHLDLKRTEPTRDALVSLFTYLPNSSITNLNLSKNQISSDEIGILSASLKSSKLEVLDLSDNNIDDAGIDSLFEGLIHSKIVDLNLSKNDFHGSNSLGNYLKDTQIKFLNIGDNSIEEGKMLSYSDLWKNSSLVMLDVGQCSLSENISRELISGLKHSKIVKFVARANNLQLSSFVEFANTITHSEVSDVDFSENDMKEEEFIILGDCLKNSKIKSLDISNNFKHPVGDEVLAEFIKKTKTTSLKSLKMNYNELMSHGAQTVAQSLISTKFTELDLSSNWIEDGIVTLAETLKYTVITHLDLSNNKIEDEGAEALAKFLPETHIIFLNINTNSITDRGAKVLAEKLKHTNLLELKLEENDIENEGLEALAKGIENTYITVLDVRYNPGRDRVLLVDSVLWENRKKSRQLTDSLKRIAPRTRDGNIDFGRNITNDNVNAFLEECLHLYQSITKDPRSVEVLMQDKTNTLSRSQIISFMIDEFPNQLMNFIASRIEADVEQHVRFLQKAEEMELTDLVSLLLLNRPAYVIDKTDNILHPYVYELLKKYKLPMYNLDIEPGRKEQIVKYFKEHSDIEGASDVIRMLRSHSQ